MIAYLDSSVLLRIVLDEPQKLTVFESVKMGISSILLKIECLRALDRLRTENHYSEEEFHSARTLMLSTFKKLYLIRITDPVVDLASQPWGISLKSLDSIHLASALLWSNSNAKKPVFLTHDKKLGQAAQLSGFEVQGMT